MSETDPHIHVEQKVVEAGAEIRNAMNSVLGVTTDAPTVVTTGCGLQVPYAMTSARPESVTCLACRDHARQEHLRFADLVERLSRLPEMNMVNLTADQAAKAAQRSRDLARRFAG
jgi:hypothetical protein